MHCGAAVREAEEEEEGGSRRKTRWEEWGFYLDSRRNGSFGFVPRDADGPACAFYRRGGEKRSAHPRRPPVGGVGWGGPCSARAPDPFAGLMARRRPVGPMARRGLLFFSSAAGGRGAGRRGERCFPVASIGGGSLVRSVALGRRGERWRLCAMAIRLGRAGPGGHVRARQSRRRFYCCSPSQNSLFSDGGSIQFQPHKNPTETVILIHGTHENKKATEVLPPFLNTVCIFFSKKSNFTNFDQE